MLRLWWTDHAERWESRRKAYLWLVSPCERFALGSLAGQFLTQQGRQLPTPKSWQPWRPCSATAISDTLDEASDMRQLAFLFATLLLLAGGSRVLADAKNPTYDDDVVPIVKQHCVNCHGNDKQKGGLNLATYADDEAGRLVRGRRRAGQPGQVAASSRSPTTAKSRRCRRSRRRSRREQIATIKLWVEQGAKENAGSKVSIPPMPKTDIGLKSVVKGRPEGPPPMPAVGKLKLEPVVVARRPGAVLALATSPWAPLAAVGGQKQVILYNTDTGALLGFIPFEHGQINSIKFSRNAQFVLVAGGKGGQSGKAVLFNVETGEKVLEVGKIETDAILAADISADQTQIAVGGPVEARPHLLHHRRQGAPRDQEAHRLGDRGRVQPGRRAARDRRPQRRAVRVGGVHRPRVLQPPRAHRDDHRRVVARRLERAGVVQRGHDGEAVGDGERREHQELGGARRAGPRA